MTKKGKDKQKSGLAGELFVAAELLKRGFQVSLTFGSAKAIDLFVYNEKIDYTFNVQVKTLRKSNCYLISPEEVRRDFVYVFVLLKDIGQYPEYFILTGEEILADRELFGSSLQPGKLPGINIGPLRRKYKNRWEVFENFIKNDRYTT